MGKLTSNSVLDAPLLYLRDNVTRAVILSGEPGSHAAANSGALAEAALLTSDFTIADGDVSGRKVTIAEQAGVAVDSNGTADHVALLDDNSSALLYVTTCPPQGVSAGGTVTIGAISIAFADPA